VPKIPAAEMDTDGEFKGFPCDEWPVPKRVGFGRTMNASACRPHRQPP
jgi:hypothetical protein